jgi:hypothetical protein
MDLQAVAALAYVGATRIYQTKGTKPAHVIVRSATVDGEGRLFITVAYEDDPKFTFRVRATSLSIPTEGA